MGAVGHHTLEHDSTAESSSGDKHEAMSARSLRPTVYPSKIIMMMRGNDSRGLPSLPLTTTFYIVFNFTDCLK